MKTMEHFEILKDKLVENYLLKLKSNKKTVYSISTAVTLALLVRLLYKKLNLPPKHLEGIPCITYLDVIKSLIRGDTVYERRKRLVLPLLGKAKGVYTEPTPIGWQIRSTNPSISKTILSDIELFPKVVHLFGKGNGLTTRFIGGKHLASLEGDEWKRHRRIVNPAFHRGIPIHIYGQLSQRVFDMIKKLGYNHIHATSLCERMTMDTIGLVGFGYDFHCTTQVNSEWLETYDIIRYSMTRLFFVLFQIFDDQLKWLFPSRVEAHQRLDHLLKRINEMIALKRVTMTEKIGSLDYYSTTSDAEKDLLTLMMEAEIAGEGKLSDEELRRNMVMFFFAGHDTTAAGMSFAIGQLARHQEIQKKAREEVVSVLGDHVEDIPSIESIKKMPYLDAIVKETLRLNSPITKTLPRIAARDVAVDGLLIPQGTLVDVDIAATHMSEANYSDPFEFKPERFLESADVTSTKQGLSYVPFGYGSHVCIGQNFSLAEQRVFLAMLLRKFEWTLALDSVHRDGMIAEGNGGVRPINLRIDFKPRF